MKILVVDDNPNDAELVKHALKPDFPQAEFTIVTQEKDLQPMVDKDEYSLVLTDYFLGWTGGFTIFRNIHDRWPRTPVIMVTETSDEEIAAQAMKVGINDYVLKRHLSLLPAAVKENLRRVEVEQEREEVVKRLSASEERYRIVSELTSDFVFVMTVKESGDLELEWMTAAFTRETGYDIDDLKNEGLEKIVYPKDLSAYQKSVEQLLAGETTSLDFRIVTREEEIRWERSKNRPIADETGRVVKIFGALKDISDEKEAERIIKAKDNAIRRAYVDVFSAVTGGRLVIASIEEIQTLQGKPITETGLVSEFEEISKARKHIENVIKDRWPDYSGFGYFVGITEALANAVKHAGSGQYRLYLRGETLQLVVNDSGPGINFKLLPKAALESGFSTKQSLGLGFSIMLQECDRVYLATEPGNTSLVLEKKIFHSKEPLNEISGIKKAQDL